MLAPWFISEVSVCGDKPFVRMPNNGKYERIPCQDLIFVAVVQGSTFCEASSEPDFIQIDFLLKRMFRFFRHSRQMPYFIASRQKVTHFYVLGQKVTRERGRRKRKEKEERERGKRKGKEKE